MARLWQDFGKASKELAMDRGKGTMASNTGKTRHLAISPTRHRSAANY